MELQGQLASRLILNWLAYLCHAVLPLCFHRPQVGKDKILIIGDSLSSDIAGGVNAGIDSCWFNEHNNENNTDIVPTYEINKLGELQKFI